MLRGRSCAWLVLVAACGGPAPARSPVASGAPAVELAATAARSMKLDLEQVADGLHVQVEASGSAADLKTWQVGEDIAGPVAVLDGRNRPVPFTRDGQRITLVASTSTVVLRYDVVRADRPFPLQEDARATMIDEQRFRGVGDRILALPEAFEKVAVPVAFTQTSLPTARVAASRRALADPCVHQLVRHGRVAGPRGREPVVPGRRGALGSA